jgi:nicotinamide riboside kinase
LAQHYQTLWCPEFAREYLLTKGKKYSYEKLLTIAKGQIELEESKVKSCESRVNNSQLPTHDSHLTPPHAPFLFIDTDMYVMKVWCEYVFGKCHQFILDEIATRKYDLYLLCNIDLPWVQDELREYPDEKTREELYKIYKDILANQSTPWFEINGINEQRLHNAVNAIDKFFKQ